MLTLDIIGHIFPLYFTVFIIKVIAITISSLIVMVVLYHIAYYLYSFKLRHDLKSNSTFIQEKHPFVSIHLPIRSEPIDLVKQFIESIRKMNYPASAFELLILSDDDENYIENIRRLVKDYVENGLNIKVLSRGSRSGFKAGALNHLLCESKGEYIVVFDVDSKPSSDFLTRTINYLESNKKFAALTVRWKPYNALSTPISEAQAVSLNFLSRILFDGREAAGGPIFLTGNGCVIRKKVLRDVGGWPEDTLIEDVNLSIKLLINGNRIKYLHDVELPIEVPETYYALKKQQKRWAYGAAQVFINNFWNIIRSNIPLRWKFEIILHVIQYHTLLFNIVLIVLSLSSLVLGFDVLLMNLYYLIFLFPFISVYVLVYYHSTRDIVTHSRVKRMVDLGRNAAVSGALALVVFISSLKAFLKLKEPWHVTPKGKFSDKFRDAGKSEATLGTICYLASVVMILKGYILSAACLLLFGLPCIYTLIKIINNKW
jgi:cellulose synthase/poly-beta-1,6-N-acetylglucosamine synthase-like glycosyltransferase